MLTNAMVYFLRFNLNCTRYARRRKLRLLQVIIFQTVSFVCHFTKYFEPKFYMTVIIDLKIGPFFWPVKLPIEIYHKFPLKMTPNCTR